ncbi:MAG: phosphate ABC transporter permease PstA [Thermoplasmata archaeon]|nr:phosphate ABC transporter permease PstA [Thermoplasmata archaeon]
MRFDRDGRRKILNWVVSGLCFLCVVAALIPLLSILYAAFINGAHVVNFSFLVSSENQAGICVPGNCTAGGIGPAIYATLVVVGLAGLISIPVGVLSGIYLSEYGRDRLGRSISFFTDVMTGTPSIVVGLFVYAVFIYVARTVVFSALSGAVALAIIMVPTITRTTEEGLRLVPNALREGAYALGIPRYRAVLQIVLSTGRGIVVTGAILAVMRAAGEVAPLLVTAFGNPLGFSGVNQPAGLLGPLIFFDATGASPLLVSAAWGASLVLIVLMLGISLLARFALRNRFK